MQRGDMLSQDLSEDWCGTSILLQVVAHWTLGDVLPLVVRGPNLVLPCVQLVLLEIHWR